MSRDKPTPGAWFLHTLNGRKVPRSLLVITVEASEAPIALVSARIGETVSNGRLLAAAPDLAEALERVLPLAERAARLRRDPHHPENLALHAARLALLKARHGNDAIKGEPA